jgi:hypothetical protein
LIKALNDGKFPSLITLELSGNNIGDKVEKELFDALRSNVKRAVQTNNINNKLPIITASSGLLLGLSTAYLAGAATLTPVGAVVAVFLAAAVGGALVGYGVGKVSQKLFVESINEHPKQELKV